MNDPFPAELIERLKAARHVAVLTGAGISAESGIATFRDADGLWARFKPEELARMDAFLDNPKRVQDWYSHRRTVVRRARPNPGHLALADLERVVERVTVITQNVDGLHERAGSSRILELHGSLERNYCVDCGRPATEEDITGDAPYACPTCGGMIRPDVVWFGEMLPSDILEKAFAAAASADVFLSIGTSAVVHPAASLPVEAARSGAFTAEINVEASAVAPYMDVELTGKSGEILPELVSRLSPS